MTRFDQVVDRLSALTPEQRALFEALRRKQQAGPPLPPPVPRVTGSSAAGDWPLSIDQERLWRLHQENPGLVSWNVDANSRLRGVSLTLQPWRAPCARSSAAMPLCGRASRWWTAAPCSGWPNGSRSSCP